ncbi:hypothetical protein AM500_13900 [Bacillus sp. FJAT-18017]|uniref:hypothetical protein n=1 Tax=Bacillus sp. FJAT-18017 TaxID=1705566 RepID=UPI0006AE8CDE|nr:hypothetical protein [Bacillus sp. FJAT-18017]ALC90758.1 hypothetical protein AM500_13900 [Bacillus sp. FJAT-18017]
MNLKAFLLTFVIVYVLISLPSILGIGHVIDWVPEASLWQKFNGYVINGLLTNFVVKTVIALITGLVISFPIFRRQQSK